MVGDLAFGAAGAQPVTLSFLALSNQTGTFGGALNSGGGSSGRSYPFTYSIPVANIWTKIAITIPGDTAGTWTMKGNATGLIVIFDLGSGSNFPWASQCVGVGELHRRDRRGQRCRNSTAQAST